MNSNQEFLENVDLIYRFNNKVNFVMGAGNMNNGNQKGSGLRNKILISILIGMLIPSAVLMGFYNFATANLQKDLESIVTDQNLGGTRNSIKYAVETVISSIKARYEDTSQAPVSPDQVKDQLDNVRYGRNAGFFVFQYDGVQLISAEDKTQEGRNLINFTDPKGNKPVREFIKTAKAGGGFVSYAGVNYTTGEQVDKVSYIAPLKIGDLEVAVGTTIDQPSIDITKADIVSKTSFNRIFNLNMILLFIVVVIAVLILIQMYLTRLILRPIQRLVQNIKQISAGDFSGEISVQAGNEIGVISSELGVMKQNLIDLIAQVLESSYRVEGASKEIAYQNQDLSQRTQSQASTLQEITANIEEINSAFHQTASNTEQAHQFSYSTQSLVKTGNNSIRETLSAMQQISNSSKQIEEIIKVVNDIAFQTNLLALNAAVEAARAGEQGRGFAVVAAEVRSLSSRTVESAKEIELLIKESVGRVDKGNTLVQQSAEILQKIVMNTEQTTAVITEVASVMKEQSLAVNQIKTSIQQMNHVTQQNAAMVEEMAASSDTLKHETEILNDTIKQFRISDQPNGPKVILEKSVESQNQPEKQVYRLARDFKGDNWDKF